MFKRVAQLCAPSRHAALAAGSSLYESFVANERDHTNESIYKHTSAHLFVANILQYLRVPVCAGNTLTRACARFLYAATTLTLLLAEMCVNVHACAAYAYTEKRRCRSLTIQRRFTPPHKITAECMAHECSSRNSSTMCIVIYVVVLCVYVCWLYVHRIVNATFCST